MTDFVAALSPDDEVAMVFVGRSDLSQNFTKDVGRLLKAVDDVRDALGFGLDALARGPSPGAGRDGRASQDGAELRAVRGPDASVTSPRRWPGRGTRAARLCS